MKKLSSLLISVLLICTLTFAFAACSSSNYEDYEDELLGRWVTSSNGKTIMYSFDKESDGTYKAACATQSSWSSSPSIYMFDEFSASETVITFKQDGKQTKHYYHFADGYLYIDGLEFEKM